MKYPNIKVMKSDIEVLGLVGAVSNALRLGGVSKEERTLYVEGAYGTDEQVLAYSKEWVPIGETIEGIVL
jgi:hypothetical protein